MARTTDPNLHALWADRLQRQPQSGLSITRFCLSEGVSPISFHSWKRRLRDRDASHTPSIPNATPAFLPVAFPGQPFSLNHAAPPSRNRTLQRRPRPNPRP